MGVFIVPDDLAPFAVIALAKATAMIEDAEATATLRAPCLPGLLVAPIDETADALALRTAKLAAVKAVLRGAILRWVDAGSGAVVQQTTGPFSATIQPQARRSLFWPSEIEQLQGVCATQETGQAFAIDTVSATTTYHADYCSLTLGALYCSCGADLAGYPIYGVI